MKLSPALFTILIIQVTEVLGFSLVLPFLPAYAQKFGAGPLQIGLILAIFSLFQFVSAPIIGNLSDRYGRKYLLIFSQISTFIGFIVLGSATTLWMILLSRIIDGALGSNLTLVQAYLSDISTKKDRTRVFGLSAAAYGVGFLIGPGLGAFLSTIDLSLPSFLAAGISLISILMTLLFVKEPKRKETLHEYLRLSSFTKIISKPVVKQALVLFSIVIFIHVTAVSNYSLFAQFKVDMSIVDIGISLTLVGFITILFQGVLLPTLIKIFGELRLLQIGMILLSLSLLLMSVTLSKSIFVYGIVVFAAFSGIVRPLLSSTISRNSPDNLQGTSMGIISSLGSISQIVGPLLGGWLLQYYQPYTLPLVLMFLSVIGLWFSLSLIRIR